MLNWCKKHGDNRSLCGERGLKLRIQHIINVVVVSLPLRGAWIEIISSPRTGPHSRSLPLRGAWIEIVGDVVGGGADPYRSLCGERGLKWKNIKSTLNAVRSLPLRGAWIEISAEHISYDLNGIAPFAGSVD